MDQSTLNGRKAYTCTPCRSKKIKCDRQRICGNCRRKEITCVWPPNGVPLEDGRERSPKRRSTPPTRASPHPSAGPSNTSSPTHMVDVPHNVVHAEQLDHSILNDPRRDPSPTYDAYPTRPSVRKRAFPFFSGAGSGDADGMVNEELMRNLPKRPQADVLLRVYLERVEWIHHPLHPPTFLAQYNKFWSMEPARRHQSVHARWLALLYMVLCLGVHFSDEEVSQDSALEAKLLQGCEDALAHSDFLSQASTETIQTIICLNLYLNNKNKVSTARSFLGLAIKTAISMGWSRIPDESKFTNTDPEGVVDRELGRRLWWSLVTQDAYTASTSGFTYLINLSHTTTGLFANVDDEYIRGGTAFHSKPMTEITAATYHLAKIEFALAVRSFIDAINANWPDASYNDIMNLDRRFRDVYERLPVQLRPDLPQPFEMSFAGSKRYLVEQRIFMGITLHNRIMRLHRAYMQRGYDDPRYAYSTQVCIESAYALLDLVKQSPQLLCRWWVVLVHVWTGGLIIAADLVRGVGSENDATRRRQREGIGSAVALLEPISRASPVALRALKVLRSLLHQDDASRKRKRPTTVTSDYNSLPDPTINSMADLEQLLREVVASAEVPACAPSHVQPLPTNDVPQDQTFELFQSLFQMNQW